MEGARRQYMDLHYLKLGWVEATGELVSQQPVGLMNNDWIVVRNI